MTIRPISIIEKARQSRKAKRPLTIAEPPPLTRRTYTLDEAALMLGVTRNTIYAAAHAGEIPCIRIGRKWLVVRAAFDRMLDQMSAPE